MTTETELRQIVDERVAAVRAKDPAPLAARMADDVTSFNVLPPFSIAGRDTILDGTRAWFDGYDGDIGYEVHDVETFGGGDAHGESVDGDVGMCTFLYHVTGTLTGGQDVDMWVRATLGCRRVEGTWLIVHDHESVPFDASTGQAVLQR